MRIPVIALIVVVIGFAALYVHRMYSPGRLTPGRLEEIRHAEERLAEADRQARQIASKALVAVEEAPADPEGEKAPSAAKREWTKVEHEFSGLDQSFFVRFECSNGTFVVECHPDWAPIGAERFHELVAKKVLDECRFFRVIEGFMVQFGISGDPAVAKEWKGRTIKDDPVKQSNKPG